MSLTVEVDQAISNFIERYEMIVDFWIYMNRRND